MFIRRKGAISHKNLKEHRCKNLESLKEILKGWFLYWFTRKESYLSRSDKTCCMFFLKPTRENARRDRLVLLLCSSEVPCFILFPKNTCRWPYVVFKRCCAKSRDHFKVLGAHSQGPCSPRRLNFMFAAYYFQHNYCSFSLLTYKMCISSHAPRIKTTTARFIGQSRTASHQCHTPFMSALWRLEFGGGSYIFWRICSLLLKA